MEKTEIEFQQFKVPEKARLLIHDCKKTGEEILSRPEGRGSIAQFEPADGLICWNLLNSVRQQYFKGNTPVFCEWGSGLGLVTLLAAMLGMTATGIEVEDELVDLSREFSLQHGIPASFIHTSMYPKDNPQPRINYKEVELFFAYPWPDQISQMLNLFEEVAVAGSIFLCYHGGRNFKAFRR